MKVLELMRAAEGVGEAIGDRAEAGKASWRGDRQQRKGTQKRQ